LTLLSYPPRNNALPTLFDPPDWAYTQVFFFVFFFFLFLVLRFKSLLAGPPASPCFFLLLCPQCFFCPRPLAYLAKRREVPKLFRTGRGRNGRLKEWIPALFFDLGPFFPRPVSMGRFASRRGTFAFVFPLTSYDRLLGSSPLPLHPRGSSWMPGICVNPSNIGDRHLTLFPLQLTSFVPRHHPPLGFPLVLSVGRIEKGVSVFTSNISVTSYMPPPPLWVFLLSSVPPVCPFREITPSLLPNRPPPL